MDQEHGGDESRPGPVQLRDLSPEQVRDALTGDPLAGLGERLHREMDPILSRIREEQKASELADRAIQERIAAALEGCQEELGKIHAVLEAGYLTPNYVPQGVAIVDKNSPEARRVRLAGGAGSIPPPGFRTPAAG